MDFSQNMAHKIHVLLVEHDGKDHDKTKNMLQYFSYEVTPVKLASTALSILSKGKGHYDLVMANVNSPDSYGFQLLQGAVTMGLLVILISDDDDALTTLRAIEQGAFLCIKKPVTMQIMRYLWQHVVREKVGGLNNKEQFGQVTKYNTFEKEFGEENLIQGKSMNVIENVEDAYNKSKKKVSSGTLEHDHAMYRKKVWTEWTEELHDKFMAAVKQLGEGRCYPKEILELMNVPGLTRMQVASHLQKCRNANWVPPSERRSKHENQEATITLKNKLQRAKTMRFGSMPQLDQSNQEKIQQYEKIHQDFSIGPPKENNVFGDIQDGVSDKGYYLNLVLNHDDETFNNGNLGEGAFDMTEELFIYGGQSVITPSPNTSSNQRYISEDGYEFPIMDSMVQDFYTLQQELVLDFNGSLQSLVLDQGYYDQLPAINQYWSEEAIISQNNGENQGQMGEESWF